MTEKTIEQAQKILGWSYPTTLRFAREHGKMENGGRKWLIPVDVITAVLDEEQRELDHRRQLLAELANG